MAVVAGIGNGVPTVFVGDEMFWGNDRFELVKWYIQKANGSAGA